ncbi:copper homeostasis protein CutC [Maritalea mediterranea]|uniref:PF03932 family protein CutC n=1 Tax=Maritalea mediterranea TaxID=2909667 RepID=A0ABS9E4A1_9HYPH|nr:copper homeostasis protein CutC [Maritalea mediterranea]MCF4097705.1 copper homeostasis protein CutC [Maritalea mediterranea]
MSRINLEICVDTPQALINAKQGGADRVELCSALVAGGLTPSRGLMQFAAAQKMPAHVMIRPREGDFCFDAQEVQLMLDDIALAQQENMQGVVLGATHKDGRLDVEVLQELVAAASGMDITLHRAFDVTPDPFVALEEAIVLGFNRILTSGQQKSALEGKDLLAALMAKAGDRIEIMPGSGIKASNVKELAANMPLSSVHASCAVPVAQSPQRAVALGFADIEGRRETSLQAAKELASALNALEWVMP